MRKRVVYRVVLRRVCECSPVDGRLLKRKCWHWRVKMGQLVVFGGYTSLKREATQNAHRLMSEAMLSP